MCYHDIETVFDEMIDDIKYIKISSKFYSLGIHKKLDK